MPRKRIICPSTIELAKEEAWAEALNAGAIPSSIPPIPPDVTRYAITPDLDELADLIAIPLPRPWLMARGHPFPHTLALHHVTGPIVGVLIETAPVASWGPFIYRVRAWDHLGGAWSGTVTPDAGGGASSVRLRRRTTGPMRLPQWFGPAHLLPAGFRL